MVLDALAVPHDLEPFENEPLPKRPWRQARVEDVVWAREHFAPWILRRLQGRSSGDEVLPKRPTFERGAGSSEPPLRDGRSF